MTDIVLNDDFDLKIINGDFVIGDSSDQNVKLIFKSNPGDLKEYPEVGVGIERYGNGIIDRFIDRLIRVQMKADGFSISKLEIKETGISIDGSYDGV